MDVTMANLALWNSAETVSGRQAEEGVSNDTPKMQGVAWKPPAARILNKQNLSEYA